MLVEALGAGEWGKIPKGHAPKNENLNPKPQTPSDCGDTFCSFCLWPFILSCIYVFSLHVLKWI